MSMERETLNFTETLHDAFSIGRKNAPSLVGALLLWLITIWIPYLNVGTTIAIFLLPTELAKGNVINPLGIFDSKYRRYMGEYLLTVMLRRMVIFGFLFIPFVPIVLSYAWSLSTYFLFEKGKNPIAAIKASNDATYGSKWTMFGISLLFSLFCLCVVGGILLLFDIGMETIFDRAGEATIVFFVLIFIIAMIAALLWLASVSVAIKASYWRQLKDNVA